MNNRSLRAHFVLHEAFEAPGAFEIWTERRGYDASYTHLHRNDSLPVDTSFDLLVVMGGPQSPSTTVDECPHFDAGAEIDFVRSAIKRDKFVIGVCLGAQMIGEALGASYGHSPNREIGVFPVTLTDDGKQDPLVGRFPETFLVGHWHGDMPGLTPQAAVLAVSEGCPRQIVRYSPKVYGFQCHFEFTDEAIEGMITNSTEELETYTGLPYVNSVAQLRAHDYDEMNNLLFTFLDGLIQQGRS